VNAYDALNDTVKDNILPIIEMTGELGYTYTKNCKDENLRGKRRQGDIYNKIQKILDFMDDRRFILDITDDASLKYDGLSSKGGGLLDPSNGYQSWSDFLQKNDKFKKQVIPVIQFNAAHMTEVQAQIQVLNANFDYIAVKLPAFAPSLPQVIKFITDIIGNGKLFVILDFDFVRDYKENEIKSGLSGIDISNIKALIPVSSSFPASVSSISKTAGSIDITENQVSDCVKTELGSKVFHGDFSSIYPKRYEMGGAGWYARIDYIERDQRTKQPIKYWFRRGNGRNTSSDYVGLAKQVIGSSEYAPITEFLTEGDRRIAEKANGAPEGKAPAYWIAVRSNLYMTMQCLYLRRQSGAFLDL